MKNIFYTFFLLWGGLLFAEADIEKKEANATIEKEVKAVTSATRGDVKIIEASESIRYFSQKIVKDYLFFYKNSQKVEVKEKLMKSLEMLSNDFRIIATTTKDSDTKDILEFLAYSKDQIEEIFNGTPNEENAALMLDYSETLLEGADSIARAHKYNFSQEEKMLMVTKKIEYLLERTTKYYMAIHVGFNNNVNKEQMQNSMNELEENIEKINLYSYPQDMEKTQEHMNKSWKANKVFFEKSESLFIPKLMFISIDYLENIIDTLTLYHSKNQ